MDIPLDSDMQIINCLGGKYFGDMLARTLKLKTLNTFVHQFPNGEMTVELSLAETNQREATYIVQSFVSDANDRVMELLLTINAAQKSGINEIHLIIPYLCYSRLDRPKNLTSLGIEVIANLLNNTGAGSITVIDIHSPNSLGLFRMPTKNITALDIVECGNKTIVAPDQGSFIRLSNRMHNEIVRFDKKREGGDLYMKLLGNVDGKDCVILDDIVDSGRTMTMAAEILMASGARSVDAYATHAFLSSETKKTITGSCIGKLTISNSVENKGALPRNVEVVDVVSCILGI